MILAAVDPGFSNTGIVIFKIDGASMKWVNAKCITTKKTKDKDAYVSELDAARVKEVLAESIKFMGSNGVDFMVLELPTGGARSSRAARALGITTVFCEALPMMLNVGRHLVTPREVKVMATGDPNAEKKDIIAAMSKIYPEVLNFKKDQQEHIADAVAVGLIGKKFLEETKS